MAMAIPLAALWMPTLITAFEREAPHMNARMVPLTTRDPRPPLIQADIDIAVGFFPGIVAQLSGGQAPHVVQFVTNVCTGAHYVCDE